MGQGIGAGQGMTGVGAGMMQLSTHGAGRGHTRRVGHGILKQGKY
jgi:hypothetical protein